MDSLCSPEELLQHISSLTGKRVLVIGDVMLDTYLIGDAQRISPEAPVPVVKVEEEKHLLGGAGNVARNIASLGGVVTLIALCGQDADGELLKNMLESSGVRPHLVSCPGRPTTIKIRVLARNQQMIRLDKEDSSPISSDIREAIRKKLIELVPDFDVVIVSDYGKGIVDIHLLEDIRAASTKGDLLKILVDPKPQNKDCYHGAYLLTPNTKETSEAARMPVGTREEILAAGRVLLQELEAKHVLTTLGADGMALFENREKVWHVATSARQVFDVTGAGDTVIATTALALAAGFSLPSACVLANYAAGIVVGKVGAATASLEELRASIEKFPPEMESWA